MRYAVYIARPTINETARYTSDGRRFATMQKAADSVARADLDNSPVYIHDTDESGYFRWFKIKAFHQMAGAEIESLDACPFPHPPVTEVYFVIKDAAMTTQGRGGESAHVLYGDPWTAVGVRQDEFDTIAGAVEYMRHHSGDFPIFRVKLERIDGEHTVTEIK